MFSSPDGGVNLHGVLASEDINPREVFCYIPNKILISTESCRNSEIAEIYRNNEELFISHSERDYYIILVFLMYERAKGSRSFWHHYFEVA